jgi:hypothetical protein
MKALTEVHFQALHVEHVVQSMLSYPNETSKEIAVDILVVLVDY